MLEDESLAELEDGEDEEEDDDKSEGEGNGEIKGGPDKIFAIPHSGLQFDSHSVLLD